MSDVPTDDEEARRRRAERLREQIDKLAIDEAPEKEPEDKDEPESPREFIERKMREGEKEKPGEK